MTPPLRFLIRATYASYRAFNEEKVLKSAAPAPNPGSSHVTRVGLTLRHVLSSNRSWWRLILALSEAVVSSVINVLMAGGMLDDMLDDMLCDGIPEEEGICEDGVPDDVACEDVVPVPCVPPA